MKTIEERITELYDTWPRMDKAAIRRTMVALADDLNAEKEKEVAELRKALEVEIAERDRLREQLRFSADDNLLDEVKRVLGDVTSAMDMQEKREREEFHINQQTAWKIWSDAKTQARQLLTRLGSHE